MIRNIEEVIKYNHNLANELGGPDVAGELLLLTNYPKPTLEDVGRLFADVPFSYKKVLTQLDINGKAIGYFELSPSSYDKEGIISNLSKANSSQSIFKEIMDEYNLFFIATNNEFGIFVAKGSEKFSSGEIIIIDEGLLICSEQSREEHILKLANGFEQFLVIAANLNQIHRQIRDDGINFEKKRDEFFDRLKKLNVAEKYFQGWLWVL